MKKVARIKLSFNIEVAYTHISFFNNFNFFKCPKTRDHRFRWYATSVGKQNTRGNVSKISVSLACYRQIGSKSTNHSPLAWRKEGQKVTLVAVIGGFRSDLSITRNGNFGDVSAGVLFSKVAYQRKRWLCTIFWFLRNLIIRSRQIAPSKLRKTKKTSSFPRRNLNWPIRIQQAGKILRSWRKVNKSWKALKSGKFSHWRWH